MNNMAQASALITQPYPDVGQLTSPYEQQQPVKDLSQYTTLKAVGEDTSPVCPRSEKDARPCPPSPENSKFSKRQNECIYVPVSQTPSEGKSQQIPK